MPLELLLEFTAQFYSYISQQYSYTFAYSVNTCLQSLLGLASSTYKKATNKLEIKIHLIEECLQFSLYQKA